MRIGRKGGVDGVPSGDYARSFMAASPSPVPSPDAAWHRAAESLAGLGYRLPDAPPPTGSWARIASAGKRPSNRSTAVRLSDDGAAVHLVDHVSGFSTTVRAAADAGPAPAELAEWRRRAARERAEADRRRERAGAFATRACERAWDGAVAAYGHPYLRSKGVAVTGLRVDSAGALLVPRLDLTGTLRSLQRIDADRGADGRFAKRYATGAPVAGTFFPIGAFSATGSAAVVEGLATGASVHAETGHPTLVAFDAANLGPVARGFAARWPRVALLVFGDDDRGTAGNPGRAKATRAAEASGARLELPRFCAACEPGRCSDFNDVAACRARRLA